MEEPKSVEPLKSFTILPGCTIPVIVGVESFPREVFVKDEGAFGTDVSMNIRNQGDEPEVFPREFVALAVILKNPCPITELGLKDHSPLPSAVVVPIEE